MRSRRELERVIDHSNQIKSEMAKSGKPDDMKAKELRFLESKKKEIGKGPSSLRRQEFLSPHRHSCAALCHRMIPKSSRASKGYRTESAKLLYAQRAAGPVGKGVIGERR